MTEANFAEMRARMIVEQLRPRGISDSRVFAAMAAVPREEFVPAELREKAYDDNALAIGHGQTISQPYVVAFMAEAAKISPQDRVLEIGGGSGYAAAVLGHLAREVHSVERIPALHDQARQLLARLGYSQVTTHLDDGTLGLPAYAPFEAILVPAAAEEVPQPLAAQLTLGGRIIIPLGPRGRGQRLMRYTREPNSLRCEDLGPFAFVPLIGEHGFDE